MKIVTYSQSKRKQELIEQATLFYAKLLNLQQSKYTLYVATRPHLKKKDNARGLAGKGDKYQVLVGIDSSLTLGQTLQTLAHEMVHVKQIVRGQYRTEKARNGRIVRYWCGKKVVADYLNRPWEIEAFKRESVLFEALVNQVEKNMKKRSKRNLTKNRK